MGLVRNGFVGAASMVVLVSCGADKVGGYAFAGGSGGVGGASAGSSGKGQGGSSSGGRGGSSSGTSGKGGTTGSGAGGLGGAGGAPTGGTGADGGAGQGGDSGSGAQGGNGGASGAAGASGAGGAGGAGPVQFQSCNGNVGAGTDCGPSANENCCASLAIPGGSFFRSYDGYDHIDDGYPATVTRFRLDRFEVTVGRFRNFVTAWLDGWRPSPGAGKHTHLDGAGIAGETGWDESWSTVPPTSLGQWDADLVCNPDQAVWTPSPGANEKKPVTCVSWIEAYAFCIYDGGFLPTETEWNYAAAGGSQQRYYPWSVPSTSTTVDPSYAVYNCLADGSGGCLPGDVPFVGSRSPTGDGRWGHADLGGSALEWALDWWVEPYAITSCIDCAEVLATDGNRIYRGGGFVGPAGEMDTAHRLYGGAIGRGYAMGIRCARAE